MGVGIDHDTASFAVNTIRRWWREMGAKAYPRAASLLVVADSGGSNGRRLRLWKRCLLDQRRYPQEVKVTDDQLATVRLRPHPFHGDWNYSIRPHPT